VAHVGLLRPSAGVISRTSAEQVSGHSRIGCPGCSFGRIRGLSNDGSVLAEHLQHRSIAFATGPGRGLRLVVAVDGDPCLVEQRRPVAGHVRPVKTGIELSPLLG
jgi:hypothetical protein